ncbi:hypothetical protein A2U94_15710 [Bacillus sp. VT 712]|uniref:hypothetical protein n=1 Tax=Bacillaceae TaxID=186817 RepID=UPI0004738286|nr:MULTISPECIES: hypothetical protein [Bacillaceae]KZB90575.1 hypothetical protein A2U94_15710 [Bacillus sp. VT 712]MDT2048434.1 hypothetical protein [Priestia flexa]WEZ08483.1 hypothetical protein P5663_00570 [Priestia flexa]
MNQSTSYKKFSIYFNIIIILFSLGLVTSTLINYKELDRGLLYIILGIIIGTSSIIKIYKEFKQR